MTGSKCALRKQQQREEREDSRGRKEKIEKRGEEREETKGRNGSVPEWRGGTENVRPPGRKSEESREKRAVRREKREERRQKREERLEKRGERSEKREE